MRRQFRELPIVSITLVVVNIIVYLICIFTGNYLYYLGGLSRIPVLYYQEYGRIIWSMFLHADTAHLFSNMIILLFLGAMLEKEIGHIWFTVVYFLSGIGGSLASLYVKVATESDAFSVGASGAVFGLDGLLLAMVLCSQSFRGMVPPAKVAMVIAFSLYDGFMVTGIDNGAHVGGLIVGFLVGLIICLTRTIFKKQDRREVQI